MNDDIDVAKSAEQFVPVMQSVSEHWQQCVRNVADQNGIDIYSAMYLVSTISVGAVFGLNFPDNIEILHSLVNSKLKYYDNSKMQPYGHVANGKPST